MKAMQAISMYSGGCDGMGEAFDRAGFTTMAKCDSDEACRYLLRKRHPNIPIFEDDTEVNADGLRKNGIDPAEISIVYGSPPCQCASVAGKRLGDADERNRWPQFLASVCDIKPRWVVAENVPGLLSVNAGRLFGDILRTLAKAGYSVGWQCWGAADVGAPHKRERLFIVGWLGDAECGGRGGQPWWWTEQKPSDRYLGGKYLENALRHRLQEQGNSSVSKWPAGNVGNGSENVEYPGCTGLQKLHAAKIAGRAGHDTGGFNTTESNWPAQPRLGGNLDGIPAGLDRIAQELEAQRWPAGKGQQQYSWEPPRVATGIKNRAARLQIIGNSCPWQQYYPVAALIAEMEVSRAAGGRE